MPNLESVEAHGGFIATIILVIFAILSYFRPPQPRNHLEMGADPQSMPVTNGNVGLFQRVPRRTLIAGSLAIIFGAYTFYAMEELGSVAGPPGPQGIPGPQGPPGASATDPRIDRIQQQTAKLEQNVKRLSRLAFLERCEQRLAAVEDQFEETAESAKKLIGVSNNIGPLGGRIAIQQGWDEKIDELRIIAKLCDPSLDSRLDPTDDELHTKTADEPPNADQDLIYKIRKFNYQVSRATILIRNLSAAIEHQIAYLRDEASHGMTSP